MNNDGNQIIFKSDIETLGLKYEHRPNGKLRVTVFLLSLTDPAAEAYINTAMSRTFTPEQQQPTPGDPVSDATHFAFSHICNAMVQAAVRPDAVPGLTFTTHTGDKWTIQQNGTPDNYKLVKLTTH